ncbi:CD180 antigen, partial [Galemys pyrenaicus]
KEANMTYNCENLGLREIPDNLPNTTEFLEFGFNFLPTIQNATFIRLINLVFLDLTRCQINWIHEDSFQRHHQLNTLTLTGNPLIFMAETSLTGPMSLKHLFLTQTGISNLKFIPVHNLENLESLHLGGNHLSSIKFPENFPTQNLKVLDFQNNAIHYLSSEDMDALKATNLSLNFNGNDIKGIEHGAFHSKIFQSLKFGGSLNLSVILTGLQNSTTQSLWLGTFEDIIDQDITSAMFEGLCDMSVESINLQKHHFSDFSPATFRCFTQLQELDLTQTHLKTLPSGIQGMKSLKKLVLNVNHFDQLCQISAASFPSLTDLYIKGNLNKLDLGVGCLEELKDLQKLDLSHSSIEASDCCHLQLKNLLHLQYLNLSYNGALYLLSKAFKECPHLEVLDLAFTHLHADAPQSPFQNLDLLQVLNLSHCHLDTSNQYLLAGLKDLRHLNFQGNRFPDGSIPNTNLLQIVGTLEILILSFCDLLSIEQQAFQSLQNISHLDLSHNNLTGMSIEALSHLKGIYLNLSANSLSSVPPHLLPVLSQQNIINLSHNPLDCTCSNIHFITWYKENLQKLEGSEETVCANPPYLRGVRLSDVELSCVITPEITFLIVLLLLLFMFLLTCLIKFLFRRKYEHI